MGAESYNRRLFSLRPNGLRYTDYNDTGVIIEAEKYATRTWVNTQISGAIAASY